MTLSPRVGRRFGEEPVFRVVQAGELSVVQIEGELFLNHSTLLLRAAAACESDLGPILDFSGCRFLDSTCVGALFRLYRLLQAEGRQLVLVVPPGMVKRSLEVCRLDRLIQIYSTLEEAQATRVTALIAPQV